jgi:hypothetical protein
MTKHPADSSIIATFGWPHSIEYILGHFRKAGTPTTAISHRTRLGIRQGGEQASAADTAG